MKNILLTTLFLSALLISENTRAQYILDALPSNGSTSGQSRAPQGSQRYIRTVYLVTATEILNSGFYSGVDINSIGFIISTAQSLSTKGSFRVYLENTADIVYSKPSTNWTNGTNGVIDNMTLVHDDSITIPATTGSYDVPFLNGSPFTYTGGSLYIAFEYQNPINPLSTANISFCNNTLTGGLRNAFSTTTLPADVTNTSSFRPATRLGTSATIVQNVRVEELYIYGKTPVPFNNPDIMRAVVRNVSATTQNVDVTFTVKDAVSGTIKYTATQSILNMPASAVQIIKDSLWSPALTVNDSIIVEAVVAGETVINDNRKANLQTVNRTVYTHADNSPVVSAIGYGTGAGSILNKHVINGTRLITGVNVYISNDPATAGKTVYGVVMDASGFILAQSATFVPSVSDLDSFHLFTFTTPVMVTNEVFYVGLSQVANATAYYPVGTQAETAPSRTGAYYYVTGLAGGVLPTESLTFGRFVIEAIIEGSEMSLTNLNFPGSSLCAANNQNIDVTITNNDILTIDFSQNNVTVSADITGASTQTFSTVLSSGTLASGASQTVTITAAADFTATGVHSITTYTSSSIDLNTSNDTLNAQSVTVNPLPSVAFNLTTDTICNNASSLTLSGGTPASGTYSGTGVSGGNFNPSVAGNGTHTITYTYNDGTCANSATETIFVETCVGLNEISFEELFNIVPNPNNGNFTLIFTGNSSENFNVEITDVQGKILKSETMNNNSKQYDISHFENGIYFLRIKSENKITVKKIMKLD